MNATATRLIALTALAGIASLAQAAYVELPGNQFTSSSVQGVNGGYSGGGNPPVSAVIDGDVTSAWQTGTTADQWPFQSVNAGIVHGTLTAPTAFGTTLNTFRIYATLESFPWDTYNWIDYPSQLKIKYSTATTNANFDNFYNWSDQAGAVPNAVTILKVNGVAAPAVDANGNTPLGTTPATSLFTQGSDLPAANPSYDTIHYIEVTTTDIPADATAIGFLFGPAFHGGLRINQIEGASVPEPASLGLLALTGAAVLRRRRLA